MLCGKEGKGGQRQIGQIERQSGIKPPVLNPSQATDFGSWKLKIVPLKTLKNGKIKVKETMAITMIDERCVANTIFEKSHLLQKLRKMIVCVRMF